MNYAVKLTTNPHDISPEDIEKLRINNVEHGQILEINQIRQILKGITNTITTNKNGK